jgi:hypothetical protein
MTRRSYTHSTCSHDGEDLRHLPHENPNWRDSSRAAPTECSSLHLSKAKSAATYSAPRVGWAWKALSPGTGIAPIAAPMSALGKGEKSELARDEVRGGGRVVRQRIFGSVESWSNANQDVTYKRFWPRLQTQSGY